MKAVFAAILRRWPGLLSFGLGLLALASVAKTAPAYLGLGVALGALLLGVLAGYRPRWDGVEILVVLLGLWLVLRLALQYLGVGEAALTKPWRDFSAWAWVLSFAVLAAGAADPLRRVRHLWLLAMGGFALGVLGYFFSEGLGPLLAGERLGFHLRRSLGVGLYAGAFFLMLLFTAPQWWQVAGGLRWPARLGGIGMLMLCLLVMIASQNRSTWLALGLVGVVGSLGWIAWSLRHQPDPRRRLVALLLGALLLVGVGALVKVPIESRTLAERQALTTLFQEGLTAAPSTPITVRLRIWRYLLAQFPQAPLLGHGFGGIQAVLERDLRQGAPLDAQERQDHAHSSYLQTLYGQGLLGCALWGTLIIWLLRDLVGAARQDPRIRCLLPATWAVLGFTASWALTDYRLSHPDMLFFTILLLLSLRLLGRPVGTPPDPPAPGSQGNPGKPSAAR